MKIGIIGLGLIGGSLALAVKKRRADYVIAYNRSEEPLKYAKKTGAIDEYITEIDNRLGMCDIIFLCVPVSEIDGIAEKLKDVVSKDVIVTDVGSTKKTIMEQMSRYKNDFTFIGGHPMAGSEQSGFTAAKEFLFENAYYLITPYDGTDEKSINTLVDIVRATGAIPLLMNAEEHDKTVGAISHVPHIIAMTLVNAVKEVCAADDNAKALASGGFKDITRIASSSPKMWNDISIANKENIVNILEVFGKTLNSFRDDLLLGKDTIYERFSSAKRYRDEFNAIKRPSEMYIIRADVEDKPGVISLVATAFAYNNINIKNIGIANNREYENGILEIIVGSDGDMKKGKEILEANGFDVY